MSPKASPVVDVLEHATTATTNVREHALAAYTRDLAAYRDGCRAMAENENRLPEADAVELLAVCGRLGIDPERLSADAAAFIRLGIVEKRVAEIEARNAARREPLPRLAAALEKAEADFVRIRPEAMRRIAEAEAAVNAARREYEAVAKLRDERTENEQAELMAVYSRFPHLFRGDMTPDELRRFLARS